MLFLVEKSYAADADAALLVGCAVTKMVKNDCGEGRQIAMRIGENIYKRKDGRWEARTAIEMCIRDSFYTLQNNLLKQAPKQVRPMETPAPVLGYGRMVRNTFLQIQT